LIVLFRRLNLSARRISIVGVVSIFLTGMGVRIAAARQNGPSLPIQPISSEQSPPDGRYIGDQACSTCHSSIYGTFKRTGMGRSTSIPSAEELRQLEKPVTIVGN